MRKLLIIFVLIITASNLLVSFYKKKNYKSQVKEILTDSIKYRIMLKDMRTMYFLENLRLSENTVLRNDSRLITINEFNNFQRLICIINKEAAIQEFTAFFQHLNELKNIIGKDKILLVCDPSSYQRMKHFSKEQNLDLGVFYMEIELQELLVVKQPYCFFIDSENLIQHLHIPRLDMVKQTEDFLTTISNRYFL